MGEPVASVETGRQPVTSVPVGGAHLHSTGPLVVRVASADEVTACHGLDLARIVWIETPLRLVQATFPEGAPLDVMVDDPACEAAGLYALTSVRNDHPVRVTIVARAGVARAARIAMALQFPVRLLAQHPPPAVLAELDEVVEQYLHGSRTSAPVEFLQSALAWWLHGDAPSPWMALELHPYWYPRVDAEGVAGRGAQERPSPDFVAEHVARLTGEHAECTDCRYRGWCQGFFKWPDPSFRCDGVMRLLARLEQSAAQLALDLSEAEGLEP